MGGSGHICLPTSSHLGQVVGKLQDYPCRRIILVAPRWPNMPGFGISSCQLKSACMAPSVSAIKEQGFSEAVAAGIEVPQEDQPDQSLLTVNVSKMRISLIYWTVHRDRPKGQRGIPSWNLPWCCTNWQGSIRTE